MSTVGDLEFELRRLNAVGGKAMAQDAGNPTWRVRWTAVNSNGQPFGSVREFTVEAPDEASAIGKASVPSTTGKFLGAEKVAQDASSDVRIAYNRILGGWYVVRGVSDTPLSGRFSSKEEAQAWLRDRGSKRAIDAALVKWDVTVEAKVGGEKKTISAFGRDEASAKQAALEKMGDQNAGKWRAISATKA